LLPYLHIFGISIPSYGLCMALGMILAFLYAYHTSKKYSFSFISLIIIAVCPIGFGLLGAKLLYLLSLLLYLLAVLLFQRFCKTAQNESKEEKEDAK